MVEAIDQWFVQWLMRLAGCLPNGDPPDMLAEPNGDLQQAAAGVRIGPQRNLVLWLAPQSGALQFWLTKKYRLACRGTKPAPVLDGHGGGIGTG